MDTRSTEVIPPYVTEPDIDNLTPEEDDWSEVFAHSFWYVKGKHFTYQKLAANGKNTGMTELKDYTMTEQLLDEVIENMDKDVPDMKAVMSEVIRHLYAPMVVDILSHGYATRWTVVLVLTEIYCRYRHKYSIEGIVTYYKKYRGVTHFMDINLGFSDDSNGEDAMISNSMEFRTACLKMIS